MYPIFQVVLQIFFFVTVLDVAKPSIYVNQFYETIEVVSANYKRTVSALAIPVKIIFCDIWIFLFDMLQKVSGIQYNG